MSSPFLNSLIVLGALLSYFCIFFLGLDGSYISDQALEASCSVSLHDQKIMFISFTYFLYTYLNQVRCLYCAMYSI